MSFYFNASPKDLSQALPHSRPSPDGEGESFAVPLKIRATGFAGRFVAV
jgi:hypothetical protein